jgi:cell division protein YceG involved in septum cleavage
LKSLYQKYSYTILLLCVVFMLTLCFSLNTGKDSSNRYQSIKVTEGDTLWEIAEQYEGEHLSKKEIIVWIQEHNDLDPKTLQPGKEIIIPFPKQRSLNNLASEK